MRSIARCLALLALLALPGLAQEIAIVSRAFAGARRALLEALPLSAIAAALSSQ